MQQPVSYTEVRDFGAKTEHSRSTRAINPTFIQ